MGKLIVDPNGFEFGSMVSDGLCLSLITGCGLVCSSFISCSQDECVGCLVSGLLSFVNQD